MTMDALRTITDRAADRIDDELATTIHFKHRGPTFWQSLRDRVLFRQGRADTYRRRLMELRHLADRVERATELADRVTAVVVTMKAEHPGAIAWARREDHAQARLHQAIAELVIAAQRVRT